MGLHYKLDYSNLSDRQIVEKILAEPHDEEAAAYLLHDRYAPLLLNLYGRLTSKDIWYDDCVDELFMHLKGKDCSWRSLANFRWESTLGVWLREVAWGKFCDILPKLIGNSHLTVSIDNDAPNMPKVQLPDGGEDSYNRTQRKINLLDEISLLDEDQKFVILKRLEGYRSKEISTMLKARWRKYGIVKYNNKNEVVIPDDGYVNVLTQRAKIILKQKMSD